MARIARSLSLCVALSFIAQNASAFAPLVTAKRGRSSVPLRECPTVTSRVVGHLKAEQRLYSMGKCQGPNAGWRAVLLRERDSGLAYVPEENIQDVDPADIEFAVRFVDVGNGDAAIVSVGTTDVIIDGGGDPRFLGRYLDERRLIRGAVELVVLSHAETDHFRGLTALLDRRLRIREYWDPGFTPTELPHYVQFRDRMRTAAQSYRVPLWRCRDRMSAERVVLPFAPEVEIWVLHSNACPEQSNSLDEGTNRSSIVLLLDVGGVKFLFTGDMLAKSRDEIASVHPREAEKTVAELLAPLAPVDVLKVPHHGSDTSSTLAFINVARPTFAIISANPKHHRICLPT